MVNGSTREFIDNLYYGSEMYFNYNHRAYFIQGWVKDGLHYLVLAYNYEAENYDPNDNACSKPIWEYSSKDPSKCVQHIQKVQKLHLKEEKCKNCTCNMKKVQSVV